MKADPVRYEQYLRKEKCQIRTIRDMTEREQRQQRRKWRVAQKLHKKRKEQEMMTPPATPSAQLNNEAPLLLPNCNYSVNIITKCSLIKLNSNLDTCIYYYRQYSIVTILL